MANTEFSVAMAVYKNDKPEQLSIALDSICTQSYPPSEIYLVIDGPIGSELQNVIDEYTNKYDYFTINQLEKNGGLGNALRVAVENCKYDLIARMDSDDISAPGRFKKQIEAYESEPADVIGGWTIGFSGDVETGPVTCSKRPLEHQAIIKRLSKRSPMSHVTVLFKRDAVLQVGNYIDLYYHEDYYLWARMIANGAISRNLPEYLVYVRVGVAQARRHGGIKYFSAEKYLRKYMLKHNLIKKQEYINSMAIRVVYQLLITPAMRNFLADRLKRIYITREDADQILKRNLDTDI